jgi:hypothetical protein
MPHSGCKEAHFLEDTPEWNIFSGVQPVFASAAKQWAIPDPDLCSTSKENGPTTADGPERLKLWTDLNRFKAVLQILPDYAPDRNIGCGPFDRCQKNLAEVLDLLDTYVKDSALQLAQQICPKKDSLAVVSSVCSALTTLMTTTTGHKFADL